jgi:hypothetical protein
LHQLVQCAIRGEVEVVGRSAEPIPWPPGPGSAKVDLCPRLKFTQHPHLRALLLSTGDALLVEHTENDSCWGDGGDGSGKNRLGQILMRVRDELLAQVEPA